MKKTIILAGVLVALSLAAYGSYETYERHISSDLKRTLTAIVDPSSSEADTLTYLRDARLQVRTKRDAELRGKAQRFWTLRTDLSSNSNWYTNEGLKEMEELERNVARSRWLQALGRFDEARPLIKECRAESDRIKKIVAEKRKEFASEHAESQNLYKELRADLGLPEEK